MVRWRQGSRKRNLKCTSMSQFTKVLRMSDVICFSVLKLGFGEKGEGREEEREEGRERGGA